MMPMTALFGRSAILFTLVGGAAMAMAAPDGMTLDAFQSAARHRMMQADADGDGKISKAEWVAARGATAKGGGEMKRDPARTFDRLDTNKDGYLDATEIDALTAKRFARLDTNNDGIVTADERAAAHGRAAD